MRITLAAALVLSLVGCDFDDNGSSTDGFDASTVDARNVDGGELDAAVDASTPDASTDAGPDDGTARTWFETRVQPLLAARCDSCHATGTSGAPAFGVGYDDVTGYTGLRGKLVGCTLNQSLIYSEGEHSGPAFSDAEYELVKVFIDRDAGEKNACDEVYRELTRTGPLPVSDDHYALDLSTMGVGLAGARLDFDLAVVDEGLILSDIKVQAGLGGLTIVAPVFETCTTGPDEELALLRIDVPANATQTLGDGSITLLGSDASDNLGLRFDALLPRGGFAGPPVDGGATCPAPP